MSYFTTRDDVRLYYKKWGTGLPVVLIHGWPLSADSWDDIALPLAEAGFQTIAYDRRGFGRSDQPWDGYDYDSLADDLDGLVKELELTDVALVGFSMGGGEVARYMSRHSGRNVTRTALVSSVVPYMLKTEDNPDGVDESTFDEMTKGMKQDRADFFQSFFEGFYGVGMFSQNVSEPWIKYTQSLAMQASLRATLACAQSFATTDFRPDLSAFKVPTLVIHGTTDQTVPIDATGRPAAKGIENATLKEYQDAPHGLIKTHQKQLASDLIEFLS